MLAYRPGRDPLRRAGAPAAICFLAVFLILPFLCFSPLVSGTVALSVIAMGLATGCGAAIAVTLRWGLALALLVIVVNGLITDQGGTVLARLGHLPLLGEVDMTLEALTNGAALALRILASMLVFVLYSSCVNPDEVLRILRPLARRSALTATLVTRLVPVAMADMARLADASQLRGPAAAAVGRGALARRIVAGSLDRSVDVAATLELRGFSLPEARSNRPPLRRSLLDPAFYAAAAVLLLGGVALLLGGAGGFDTYPRIELDTGRESLALAATIPLCAAIPFAWARARTATLERASRA